jgi:HEAT repeat protein
MSHFIWNLEELTELSRSEDKEVRYWAVDRLVRYFPEECCDAIAEFLLDDHDATPQTVARHLGEHGSAQHHTILLRGFRVLRGVTPGLCLQALARLGHSGIPALAAEALKSGELSDPAMALVVETLAVSSSDDARKVMEEILDKRVELLVEPAALRGTLRSASAEDIHDLLARMLVAVESRGAHRSTEVFRALMDCLGVDDAFWCLRTGPSGHIELRKTIKAVESGYDCDIFSAMGEPTIQQISQRFRAGKRREVIRAIAEWTTRTAKQLPEDADREFVSRLSEVVAALSDDTLLGQTVRYGEAFGEAMLGFHLSVAFAVARGFDARAALRRARGDLDRLLKLAEAESSHLVGELPVAVALVCRDDEAAARKAQEWCLRMLEAQGPFFPKVMALETLGELRAFHFIPEVMEYLGDENSYVYGAAERALGRMGDTIVMPAVTRIQSGMLEPDAAHSLLVLLCDLGTHGAYEAVTRHFDWFMSVVGPGTTAEWVSLFGVEETIDPLRDWLDDDPAMVGRGLLLLRAIHNVTIPEEDEILQAIEDERARQVDSDEPGVETDPEPGGGSYVM